MRARLTAPLTLYIAPPTGSVPPGWDNGNDANDGLSDAYPFATRQHAWNYARDCLDLAGQLLTFQLCDGTFTDDFIAVGPLLGGTRSNVFFQGDSSSYASCLINAPNSCFSAYEGAAFTVRWFKVKSSGGSCLVAGHPGSRITFGGMEFGQTNAAHIMAWALGYVEGNGSPYVISGGAAWHAKLDSWGTVLINPSAISMPSGLAFTSFCTAGTGNGCFKSLEFSGTGAGTGSTGAKYQVNEGATVLVGGAGSEFFPGYASSGVCDANSIYL